MIRCADCGKKLGKVWTESNAGRPMLVKVTPYVAVNAEPSRCAGCLEATTDRVEELARRLSFYALMVLNTEEVPA